MKSATVAVIAFFTCAVSFAIAGDNRWTFLGPEGGGIDSFTFHPQIKGTIYASGNGVFRSRDFGLSWERLPLAGGILRIHPKNPGTIVAALWDMVYASTNKGNTWQVICPDAKTSDGFSDLEFHSGDPQILYGVTHYTGVFKSTDGGKSWTRRSSGLKLEPADPNGRAGIEVDPTDGNRVYALLASSRVYKTTDGGESWVELKKGLDILDRTMESIAIDVRDPETLYVAGQTPAVYKSTSGGSDWFLTGMGGEWYEVAVDPKNSRAVYAGSTQVGRSTDGGESCSYVSMPWPTVIYVEGIGIHPSKNLVFAGTSKVGIFRSSNNGKTWRQANRGLDAMWVYDLQAPAQQANTLFASPLLDLYRSLNGGTSWEVCEGLAEFEVDGKIAIHPKDPNLIAVPGIGLSGDADAIALSRDGGTTWEFKIPWQPAGHYQAYAVAMHPTNRDVMYVALSRRDTSNTPLGLVKTTDGGETWRLVSKGLSEKRVGVIAFDARDSSTMYAGTWMGHQGTGRGRVFRSTDGGESWKERSKGLGEQNVRDILVDKANSSVIYAATGAATYKSTDAGRSWVLKNGTPTFCLAQHPSNKQTLVAGGQYGLWISTDAGENWSAFDSTGLGPFQVWDFLFDPADAEKFLIGTTGGVYTYTRKVSPAAPVIEQLLPASGKVGDTISIKGKAFGQAQSTSKVLFVNLDAGAAQSWSDTSIQVAVPAGARTGPVTVTVLAKRSNPYEFIVLPATGNVEPTSGPAAGGTRVTIIAPSGTSGTQFNVLFGSAVALGVGFTPPNIITCTSPAGSGTVDVKVTSSVTSTTVGTFTYQ
ncbi:MAG: IPT/TIG domain-containing protein [Acidobacteriota bacterium]